MTCLIDLIETNIFRMIKVPLSSRKAAKKLTQLLSVIQLENYELSGESSYDMFDKPCREEYFPLDRSFKKFL